VNRRRVLAALLAGVPLTLGVGAGTAAAAPAAPLAGAITTPVDQAPAGPGATTFALGGMQRVVVLSCQPAPDRLAWAVPSHPGVVAWMAPPVAYISGTIPIIDTDALGWPVELVGLGSDGPGSVPVFRCGCVENHSGAAGGGQSELSWGDPGQISSTTATGLKVINPAARPGPGAALAILPGASGTDSPAIGARPITTTAAWAPGAAAPASTAPGGAPATGPVAPAYSGTPAYSAPSGQTSPEGGGGTPWGSIIFGILTVLFAAGSRLTSRRIRREQDVEKIPLRAHLYGIAAAVTGLIAAAFAPTSPGGFLGAAVLSVTVGLVLSAQRAAHAGQVVSVAALVRTARVQWQWAGALTPDRIAALEGISGWSWHARSTRWDRGLHAAKTHIARHGHLTTTDTTVVDGFALGRWITRLRADHRAESLTREQVDTLQALPGWVWGTPGEQPWRRGVGYLHAYAAEHGSAAPPLSVVVVDTFPLGRWVAARRRDYHAGTLKLERIRALEALPGWSWQHHHDRWRQRLAELRDLVGVHGTVRAACTTQAGNPRLGRWVQIQRTAYRAGTLSPDRIHALEALPSWEWNPRQPPTRRG